MKLNTKVIPLLLLCFGIVASFRVMAEKQLDSLSSRTLPTYQKSYEKAFSEINEMLDGKEPLSFKKAVFITENAFYQGQLDYGKYRSIIDGLVSITNWYQKAYAILGEDAPDSVEVKANGAIFKIMKDTVNLIYRDKVYSQIPYSYDFEDNFGKKNWEKMFVTKLLETHTGNCHSLPFLYRIIAEQIGAKCWLSFAPYHIYLKNYSAKIGWYNTELTSYQFPTDGWIMASGSITLDAIRNGVYMDTLSLKQSVAFCLLDLANGHNRKSKDYNFALRCAETALKYLPTNANCLLLKAESLKEKYLAQKGKEEGKAVYSEMQGLYMKIYKLGYREMPERTYKEWINSLNLHKDKFVNHQINPTFNQLKPSK